MDTERFFGILSSNQWVLTLCQYWIILIFISSNKNNKKKHFTCLVKFKVVSPLIWLGFSVLTTSLLFVQFGLLLVKHVSKRNAFILAFLNSSRFFHNSNWWTHLEQLTALSSKINIFNYLKREQFHWDNMKIVHCIWQ